MTTARTHFVYRVLDEFGVLLYVGCTYDPVKRWRAHRSERSAWVPYAQVFKMVGPFPKQQALDIERNAIRTERPAFNYRPEHRLLAAKHADAVQQVKRQLKADGLYINMPTKSVSEDWDRLHAQHADIMAAADEIAPHPSVQWREDQYLAVRAKFEATA